MKPGTEMDKVMADIFGWEYFGTKSGIVVKKPNGETCHAHFSTEWTGMRLVVEEMQRRGWKYAIESEGEKVHARFLKPWEGDYAERNGAETAPHAITVAAIKALQGEGEQNG